MDTGEILFWEKVGRGCVWIWKCIWQVKSAPAVSQFAEEPPHILLIVEDDALDLMLIEHQVRRCGCDFDSATSGEAGLEKVRNKNYTIAIIDIGLPMMPGTILAKKILDLSPHTQVALITGNQLFDPRQLDGLCIFLAIKPIKLEFVQDLLSKTNTSWLRKDGTEKRS